MKIDQEFFKQFGKYFIVGGIAFVVDAGLLWVLTEYMKVHYVLSATLSFTAGLITNYFLSVIWVFIDRKYRSRMTEFFIFSIIGMIGLAINDFFLFLITEIVGIHYMISKMVIVLIVFLWNFFARKYILFHINKNNFNH